MRKRITAALTAFCLVLCLGASALALEPLGQPVQGMDVSAWQGEIDFEQVRAWGIRTVYIRAAVGQGRQDKDWRANYRKAKAAGLKVGLYHYVTARSQDQAQEQAEFFAGLMEGLDMDCRPAMDFESFGDMSKEQINQAALAYLTRLERLCGGKPAVYSNSWTAAHVFDQRLADYPLWIAEYGPDQPREGGPWKAWAGFQYTSQGRVQGIQGNVDLDRFTPAMDWENAATTPQPEEQTVLVQSGDTLWAISRKYGVSVEQIVQQNGIRNPNLIYPGQRLQIPSKSQKTGYTVQPGDTLWAISREYGVSVERIVQQNGIRNPNLIYPGQQLQIPS